MCTHIITYKRAIFLNVFFSLQKWSRQKLILEQGIFHFYHDMDPLCFLFLFSLIFLARERGTSANESNYDRD